MKHSRFLAAFLVPICMMGFFISTSANAKAIIPKRPKLIVGLVIDQMRWDYLYRYASRYGKGGFNRLLKQGFSCQNTNLAYIPAFTACGHASIYTGSVPAINGITGNEWIIQSSGYKQYCTEDTAENTIGSSSKAGKMSPRNLLSTTIGDELKLATNFKSKVIGIAIKDRGGILPAGHAADAAYWFDELTGNWITSSYYRKDLPDWVNKFNSQKIPEKYLIAGWNTLYPLNTYLQSTADSNKYEGAFKNEISPVFPHHFQNTQFNLLKSTPFANSLTFEFAKKAIASENLGKDEIPDLLAISLSGTDYVGHQFGPNAVEIEDTYLRLDLELENFLNYLDQIVGKDNYTFFLTADHGAAHNPNFLIDHKIPGGYWDAKDLEAKLNAFLATKYHTNELIMPFLNYQLQFNYPLIIKKGIDYKSLKRDCIQFIQQQQGITYAVDLDEIAQSPIPSQIKDKMINGYNLKRSGVIQLIPDAGWFQLSTDKTGTIHGSWNPYDSHIPLIFMGWGIKKGVLHRNVSICDIAPTLSALLHIQEPSGNVGVVIKEALK
jgi:arylsulfatase A-like enzyme